MPRKRRKVICKLFKWYKTFAYMRNIDKPLHDKIDMEAIIVIKSNHCPKMLMPSSQKLRERRKLLTLLSFSISHFIIYSAGINIIVTEMT